MTTIASGRSQGTPGDAPAGPEIRNVAIIAHVDHGKTTLVDNLLKQSGNFRSGELEKLEGGQHGLIMDSNPLERERGITILSKNCSIAYTALDARLYRINIIDTPGHADFGGEVERVLRMADGCLLLVDAFDGPMPQTRFVLGKALEVGLKPVVVVNKIDRPDARALQVIDEVFDLLVELGAEEHAVGFSVVFASAREGWATTDLAVRKDDLRDVFEAIVREVPPPRVQAEGPLQILLTSLDYSEYVGRIGIGRVFRGSVRTGQRVAILHREGGRTDSKVGQVLQFVGLNRLPVDEAGAGDLCALVGLDRVEIGDTVADVERPEALPPVRVDEPTMTMLFRINDSPFGGQEGQFVTSRQIRERLDKELQTNVAMRVEQGRSADEFMVSGRGVLSLGILIETMRREGFELSVGKPEVILKEIEGKPCEPVEELTVDVPNPGLGAVLEMVGARKGELRKMEPRGEKMTHLVFEIPSRSLIGLRGRVLTATQGEAIMHHSFVRFAPKSGEIPHRAQGVLIALEGGPVTSYAVENLHDRGYLFVEPGDRVYEGQVVGEHNRDNDLTVNITRAKQLTNFRVSSKEATVTLKAPRKLSLEQALEYIEDDELVEVTPACVRMRKKLLQESMRKRAERQARDKADAEG
ncbi:MAG: translational GTPase TypA [Phycisphaerae bacterium]|nr:translational GTPase TypA [Phycisphaerae bacterium]